jgi:glycosyltransferase involved in cell wall biosynthesis
MGRALMDDFEVRLFCLDEPGQWASELRAQRIPVECLWRQPGLDLAMSVKLARALRRCGAQIVHAHQSTPWIYAALSRLLYARPRLLLEEHGRFFPELDRPLRRLVNRLLIRRLTHRFVAVSEDVRRRLEQYEGLKGTRIEVIYNGVRSEAPLAESARAALRQELGFPSDALIVGTAGRFDPIKNLPLLVRSLATARARDARIYGLLIGDGAELPSIRALIGELGLADSVRLTGYRADARLLVQCMDLFVLSSFSEGTSMALLEAMAAGLPVVVTAVGGNPEVVCAGETGWVVPSEAADALTAALLEAVKDSQLRRCLGSAARRRFEERFTLDKMISSYRQLYRSMLAVG